MFRTPKTRAQFLQGARLINVSSVFCVNCGRLRIREIVVGSSFSEASCRVWLHSYMSPWV